MTMIGLPSHALFNVKDDTECATHNAQTNPKINANGKNENVALFLKTIHKIAAINNNIKQIYCDGSAANVCKHKSPNKKERIKEIMGRP
jgi:hypothetical protein